MAKALVSTDELLGNAPVLTSSPSRFSRGAEMNASDKVLSWPFALVKIIVSPDKIDLTFARRGAILTSQD